MFINKLFIRRTNFVLLWSLFFMPGFAYSDALEDVPSSEKAIGVRSAQNSDFSVQLKTDKSSYRANEAIHFKVKGSRTFFLYLFNYIKDTRQAVAILPNRYQTDKNIKYSANNWYPVPNKNIEFFSDRSGKERVIMIASTKYLDVNKLLKKTSSKGMGDFYQMDDPLSAFDSLINDTYQTSITKRIGVRETGSRLPNGIVIKELYLRIK